VAPRRRGGHGPKVAGKLCGVIVDVWMQHPTRRFLDQEMFASLRRWTGDRLPRQEPAIELTIAAMDEASVDVGLLSAWHAPGGALISNDEVHGWVAACPDRFAGVASVDLARPMQGVRELRRCVEELGFVGLRVLPWLWEAPPTDRRYYPLFAACVDLGVPFFTQVGHTGPLRPSEPGRPIPYIDQVAIDFPELVVIGGHIGYPWTEEMIAVARKHERVYIDTSAYTSRRYPPELVRYMGSGGGARKVLFGSNYPMITPAQALEHLAALQLAQDALELFLGGNAERLLGFALCALGQLGARSRCPSGLAIAMARLLPKGDGRAATLRQRLEAGEMVLAPGCYDALGARLVEEAGFPAVYMTGFGSAASALGRPDVGLMTLTEMVGNARRIAQAVEIPVIADADTGYGNPINVIRTVREYESAGVAAIHLEDQVIPKKCGHMEGKEVLPAGEMIAKVSAAVAARRSSEFLIIARTDARAVEGLDSALDRAHLYREAGADVLFVEAPQSRGEIEAVARSLAGVPLLFNYAEGGRTPPVTHQFLRELGFAIVIFPLSTLLATTAAVRSVLARIEAEGTPINVLPSLPRFDEFLEFIGMPEIRELERRFPQVREDPAP